MSWYRERLRRFCNQPVSLERQAEPDGFGNMTYNDPVIIKVRKQGGTKLVRDVSGETVACSVTVFATDEIRPMDKVDGAVVISSGEWVDGAGTVIGWEAYL